MTQNGHQQCSAQIKTAFLVNVAQRFDCLTVPTEREAPTLGHAEEGECEIKTVVKR